MIIQNFKFENTRPGVQRRVYANGASNVFYGTFEVLENGEPYEGEVEITKNGVEVEPEEGTGRYSLCKLAGDPAFNAFELRAHGVVHKLLVEYAENGTGITDEGGGSATGVQAVNGVGPDAEGNVNVFEVYSREDPSRSVDGDDMMNAIEDVRELKTEMSSTVKTVNGQGPDADGDVALLKLKYEKEDGDVIEIPIDKLGDYFYKTPEGGAHLQDVPPPERTAVTMATLPATLSANTLTLEDEDGQTLGVYRPNSPNTIVIPSGGGGEGSLPEDSGDDTKVGWQSGELVVDNDDGTARVAIAAGGDGKIAGINIAGQNGAMPSLMLQNGQMIATGTDYQAKTITYPDKSGRILVDADIAGLPTAVLSGVYTDDTEFSLSVYVKND